jgi:hypothetical protein
MRFIYTSDAAAKDALAVQGYTLLYSVGPMWVFDNPSGVAPDIGGLPCALSDTMTF